MVQNGLCRLIILTIPMQVRHRVSPELEIDQQMLKIFDQNFDHYQQ